MVLTDSGRVSALGIRDEFHGDARRSVRMSDFRSRVSSTRRTSFSQFYGREVDDTVEPVTSARAARWDGYEVTASGGIRPGHSVECAFRASGSWRPLLASFTGPGGSYQGESSLGGFAGEWLKLSMPYARAVCGYVIESSGGGMEPSSWMLLGGDGGGVWDVLDEAWAAWNPGALTTERTLSPACRRSYSAYALIIRASAGGADCLVDISRFRVRCSQAIFQARELTPASVTESSRWDPRFAAGNLFQEEGSWHVGREGRYSSEGYDGDASIGGVRGEHVRVALSEPGTLVRYRLSESGRVRGRPLPSAWVVLGSNDGRSWCELDRREFNGGDAPPDGVYSADSEQGRVSMLALVATRSGLGGDPYVEISRWGLFVA